MEKAEQALTLTENSTLDQKKEAMFILVLSWFVHFGADEDILMNTHPHIGTNKLPKIIEKMREEIIMQGEKFILILK